VRLTARELNRTTLHRQLLLERADLPIPEAVHRVTALQAQEPASPYLALWARVAAFDPTALDEAFASGTVVKASLMRITLHAVEAADYPVFHAAMRWTLRASRLYDRRFKETDLTIAAVDAFEPELRSAAIEPRTSGQMDELLAPRFGEGAGRAWWAYRTYAPLHHVPTGGAWSFGRRSAFRTAPVTLPEGSATEPLDGLVRRYLRGFGPASVADIAAFTLITRVNVRAALERMGEEIVTYDGPDGTVLVDLADGTLAPDLPAPPRLLPMWDSLLLAYADRARIIPPDYRPLVIRRNGDTLPTLLVDGQVAGVWRFIDDAIEASAFAPLSDAAWAGLATEAASLAALLRERDPAVYRRYHRWWERLPAPAEVRRLL
jgi:hypothetical protein